MMVMKANTIADTNRIDADAAESATSGGVMSARLKAASLHFAISALIVAAAIAAGAYAWFPGALALAAGLVGLVFIMLIVDLVLGPLLTFIVYKPAKKSLKFDLSVIVALQLAAFAYGAYSIYMARPVYVAFVKDRFETVAAAQFEEQYLAEALPEYRELSLTGPRWVGVKLPTDPEERAQLMLAETSGISPAAIPRYYESYEATIRRELAKAKPLTDLERYNPPDRVRDALSDLPAPAERMRFFPLMGIDRDLTVVVDGADGRVLAVLNLKPWG